MSSIRVGAMVLPSLSELRSSPQHNPGYLTKAVGAVSRGIVHYWWPKPELRDTLLSIDVDVRRLDAVVGQEEETKAFLVGTSAWQSTTYSQQAVKQAETRLDSR